MKPLSLIVKDGFYYGMRRQIVSTLRLAKFLSPPFFLYFSVNWILYESGCNSLVKVRWRVFAIGVKFLRVREDGSVSLFYNTGTHCGSIINFLSFSNKDFSLNFVTAMQ